VHEIGLSQGILGVKRTVILRDEEVEGFTNLAGLIYIEFPQDDITCAYSELDRVLRREGLIQ
jgi:predicted nucleotide-binding protein